MEQYDSGDVDIPRSRMLRALGKLPFMTRVNSPPSSPLPPSQARLNLENMRHEGAALNDSWSKPPEEPWSTARLVDYIRKLDL